MQQFLELKRHAVVTDVYITARNSINRKPPAPSNSISMHAFDQQSDLTVESNDKRSWRMCEPAHTGTQTVSLREQLA